ncbi:multidrug effflux MFS transporter [Pseudomonas typographi]|uniref:multidrug effflux MFS transporter n=1 Tax=Pseudomonas typographi TaxID=2715964 RepID=UPI00168952B7|nr:multidrug effflux MFS transporter [Pseudomonas typographi]MBD1589431.1 multidrug effflux MFS transporter [Pseudomonas typographi]
MNLTSLLILGALSAFGPLAIDFYLPGFPSIAQAFGTDEAHVQATLSAYFLGLSIGQLVYGPVADRFGRRRPLLFGIVLFTLASVACGLAPGLPWLIGARFLQALGGCAGMVLARAIVTDKCDTIGAAKAFSQLMLVMGLAPILAPILGGLLVNTTGWRWIFFCLALFSGLSLAAVALGLPESLPAHHPRHPLSGALRRYASLLADGVFVGNALTGGVAMAGMFAYIAGAAFVIITLYGVPAEHFGWVFGTNAAGFVLVAQVNARLLARFGPAPILARAIAVHAAGGVALVLVALAHPAQLWPLLLPLFVCVASLGCIIPNASACAMNGQGHRAGSASALLGCLQFCIASFTSWLVGAFANGTAVPMAAIIALCALCAAGLCKATQAHARRRAVAAPGPAASFRD